jgi:uncharacterized protein (TIGR03435 family)
LKLHRDTKEFPVYALIPARTGVKLPVTANTGGRAPGTGGIAFMERGWIQGTNVGMPSLIRALSPSLDRPLVDKTNFKEPFDFTLQWTPDPGATAGPAAPTADPGCPASFAAMYERMGQKPKTGSCPSLFTAVQEQLGLKLDAQKLPIEVLGSIMSSDPPPTDPLS